jgi:hypothetical protein
MTICHNGMTRSHYEMTLYHSIMVSIQNGMTLSHNEMISGHTNIDIFYICFFDLNHSIQVPIF